MKTNIQIKEAPLTRRQFLRGATLSATAFMIVPGAVLGLRGATPPSEKLNLAGISSRLPVEEANGETVVNFGLEVPDMFVLAGVIRKLERLPGVLAVHRVL